MPAAAVRRPCPSGRVPARRFRRAATRRPKKLSGRFALHATRLPRPTSTPTRSASGCASCSRCRRASRSRSVLREPTSNCWRSRWRRGIPAARAQHRCWPGRSRQRHARGRSLSSLRPRDTERTRRSSRNEPVDATLASLVDVRTVDLRTPGGTMLFESEIDAAVVELVVEASEADAIVLRPHRGPQQDGRARAEPGVRRTAATDQRRRGGRGRCGAGAIQPPRLARRAAKRLSRDVHGIEVLRRAAVFGRAVGAAEVPSA